VDQRHVPLRDRAPDLDSASHQRKLDLRAGEDKGRILPGVSEEKPPRKIDNLEKFDTPDCWQAAIAERLSARTCAADLYWKNDEKAGSRFAKCEESKDATSRFGGAVYVGCDGKLEEQECAGRIEGRASWCAKAYSAVF